MTKSANRIPDRLSREESLPDPLTFIVRGPPVPKGRPRLGRGRRVYTPTRTLDYEALVRACASAALAMYNRGKPKARAWRLDASYLLTARFYMPNARRVDIDNISKCALDSLNGVAYRDDSQVIDLVASRRIDRLNPRAEIRIEIVPDPLSVITIAMHYHVETERETDGRWLAEVVELPGAMAYGETQDEAVAGAEALALRIIADRSS